MQILSSSTQLFSQVPTFRFQCLCVSGEWGARSWGNLNTKISHKSQLIIWGGGMLSVILFTQFRTFHFVRVGLWVSSAQPSANFSRPHGVAPCQGPFEPPPVGCFLFILSGKRPVKVHATKSGCGRQHNQRVLTRTDLLVWGLSAPTPSTCDGPFTPGKKRETFVSSIYPTIHI